MVYIVTLVIGWLLLYAAIALFETFYNGYRSPIDWYYHEINKDPKAGMWYYGSVYEAKRRGGSLYWELKRKYPTTISGQPEDD